MQNKLKLKGALILFVILLLPFAYAIPPQKIQQFTTGYTLKIPQDVILKLNEDYTFEFHVYNITDGVPIQSDISCYFHLYDSTGSHSLELETDTIVSNFDYEFYVDGNNFSVIGDYYYNIQCNSSSLGGYDSQLIEVTSTGDNVSASYLIMVIAFLIISIIFIIIGYSFTNWIIRAVFYTFGLLGSALALNSASIIVSKSSGLLKMGTTGLVMMVAVISIMFLYLFINWMVEIFKQFKQKEKITWDS